jgi:eukaryotic-like serine/threonine-protein kinase
VLSADTLSSEPSLTLRLAPAIAQTLVSAARTDRLHGLELPELHLADSADLRPIRTLGEGGMGRVLLASQGSLDREVAVKSALRADHDAAHALILEGVITGKLEHPNIPPVHQLGRDDQGNPILVMKRIEGARWSELLADKEHPVRRDNPLFLREEEAAHLEILTQVSNALHYAHSRGVFHRDVKPDNVMIGTFGEVYLIDWGVAWSESIHGRVQTEPAIVGSAAYMAPELVWGEKPDARTDVYLLGATLHHVLTGRYRHGGATAAEAMRSAAKSEPSAYGEDVPAELAALCNRATSLRREDRPESAYEFVQEIRAYLTHRASIRLTRRATQLLSSLSEKHDSAVATECRFALDEALRHWPENADAKEARAKLFGLLIEQHLQEESPAAARALASELGDAAYDAKIKALEERLAARKRLEQRALEAEREADVSAGQRAREIFLTVMLLVVVGRSIYRVYHPLNKMSLSSQYITIIEVAVLLFVPTILAALFASRQIARTEAGRAILSLIAITGACLIANRMLGLLFQANIVYALAIDCLFVAGGFAIASLRTGRWLLAGTAVGLTTGVTLLIRRDHPAHVMNVGAVLGIVSLFVGQRFAARRAKKD